MSGATAVSALDGEGMVDIPISDAGLGLALHLFYHPKLLALWSCPDASPVGARGKTYH